MKLMRLFAVFKVLFSSWNVQLNAPISVFPACFSLNRWWCALGVDSCLSFVGLLSPTGLRQHLALLLRIAGRRNSPFPWVPCTVTRGVLRMKQWTAGLIQTQSFHPLSHTGRQLIRHSFYAPLNSLWNYLHLSVCVSNRVKSRLSMDNTSTPLPGSPAYDRQSPARTVPSDWSPSCSKMTPSSIHSNGSYHTLTPSSSPVLAELQTNIMNDTSAHNRPPSSVKSSQRRRQNRTCTEEALLRPSFEPKNLLSLFEKPD